MFKLFLKGVALLLCVGTLVLAVNFKVDKYGFFQGGVFEREVALTLLEGNAIAYDEVNFNEREIMRLYIQNMPKALDTVVVGSSRAMQITKDFANKPDSFFNFGVSGADIRDVMNTYYYLEKDEKLPKNLVLVVEPWFFNGSHEALSTRSNADHYKEFLDTVLGFPSEFEKPDYGTMFETIISPSVFQENIEFYFRDKDDEKHPVVVNSDSNSKDSALRMPDGTQLYPLAFRKTPQAEVDFAALSMINNSFFCVEGFNVIDSSMQNQFEAFIKHMQKKGVKVSFILSPYHPIVYDQALMYSSRFPAFFEVEPYVLDFAKKNNIDVYGSYDPKVYKMKASDFHDGLHTKRESIKKIFSGFKGSMVYSYLESEDKMVYSREDKYAQAQQADKSDDTENTKPFLTTARIPK